MAATSVTPPENKGLGGQGLIIPETATLESEAWRP